MSFNNPFDEDLERTATNKSQYYKDFPEFEHSSNLINNLLAHINQTQLTLIKNLLNEYEEAEDSNKHEVGGRLSLVIRKTTESFRKVNELIKDINNHINDIESNHEDIEILNYLKQKESILIKLIKNSLNSFKGYQKKFESYQMNQLSELEVSSSPQTPSRQDQTAQTQIQITYEPLNSEDLEQQTLQIEEREREIQKIQQDTLEINEIFENLSTIINEQQFQIDNIENHLFSYNNDVRNASSELRRAERYQRRSGGRMLCCLFILLGVVGFIISIGIIF